ncbi:MAG: ABC transporter ATP-binding protein, partial [Microbacterium sp.]
SSHILSELEEVVDDAVFLLEGETVDTRRVEAAARRARPWRVRIAGAEASVAAERVAATLGVAVTTDRRDVIVAFDSDEAAAAALRSLVSADLAVAEFAAAQGSLEHTFLDLGKGVPPASPPGTMSPTDLPDAPVTRPDADEEATS